MSGRRVQGRRSRSRAKACKAALDAVAARWLGRATAGTSQGRRLPLTPGQRHRRRRLDEDIRIIRQGTSFVSKGRLGPALLAQRLTARPIRDLDFFIAPSTAMFLPRVMP